MKLSGMASLLLGHGGWPLHEAEAVGVVERFFLGKCASVDAKRRLMRRLGVTGEKFSVATAHEHAVLYTRAALAELQSHDLIESKEVGPGAAVDTRFRTMDAEFPKGRYLVYKKTEAGRATLADLATRGRLAGVLRDEGWP